MNPRILIVEDERIVALDLSHTLEALGYVVAGIASRAQEAIDEAEKLHPDLVLMDINLGDVADGTEAAGIIAERWRIPIVFLTAYSERDTLARAEATCPYGYLVKPYKLRELEATLRMALARRRAELAIETAEERLRRAVDAAALGVWEWQSDTDRLETSGQFARIAGAAPARLREGPEAFLAGLEPGIRETISEQLDAGQPIATTLRLTGTDGKARWVDLHAMPHRDANAQTTRVVGVISDATARLEHESVLRQAKVVFDNSVEGILILDPECRIVSMNPAFTTLTGYGQDVLGRNPLEFLHARRAGDTLGSEVFEADQRYWSGEVMCMRADGTVFPCLEQICTVRDAEDRAVNHVLTLADISALRQTEKQLNYLAYHDALTGLGNRHLLEERLTLDLEAANARRQRLALMFIDLDGFKLINDTLGHAAGDQLLQAVGQRIQSSLRRSDLAIRMGGDEFVVIAPEISRRSDCALLADKLLQEIRAPIQVGNESVAVSASIGIALFPDDGTDRIALVKACDSAMYAAKGRGRNRYSFFSRDIGEQVQARLTVEQGLRRALERGQFELRYQPIVSLVDGRVDALEVHVHFESPEGGTLSSERFMAVAEECGLSEAVGGVILRLAVRQGARLHAAGFGGLRLTVNVSARQLANDRFVARLDELLSQQCFPADCLELEVTESTIQQLEQSGTMLGALKQLGVTLAIDNFGTGRSPLGLLKSVPVDALKIDSSFVAGLPDDTNDRAIAAAIASMGLGLGLAVTAVGVTDAAQHAWLKELGCVHAQGPLYGDAMTADALPEKLKQ
ncbi:MAG: EAL domain-containing protein [Gammaproteobacteria bacterium]|nr:EAL domain-containing protein [Gammaproteobacteria bacterium]